MTYRDGDRSRRREPARRPYPDRRGADSDQRQSGPRGGRSRETPRGSLSRSTLWTDEERDAAKYRDSWSHYDGPQPLRARWDPVPPPTSPPQLRRRRAQRHRSGVGWFLHHYGWRAYAVPVLVALTVVAVVGIINQSGPNGSPQQLTQAGQSGSVTVTIQSTVPTTVIKQQPGPTTTVDQPEGSGSGGDGTHDVSLSELESAHTATALPTPSGDPAQAFRGVVLGLLPAGAPFAKTGAGTYHVIPGSSQKFGHGSQHRTFTIEAEDGISTAADDTAFADAVMQILDDQRSWAGSGEVTLQRVDSGDPDFKITLASQMTIRGSDACGWDVQLEASCYNYIPGRVFINDARWVRGAEVYGADLASYRVYAINHEVGHALGHHHEPCPTNEGLAPVMMQQSWSTFDNDLAALNPEGAVSADGKKCRYNPFPFPDADAGPVT